MYLQKWILPDFSFAQKFPLKHKNLGKFYTERIYRMKSLRDVDPDENIHAARDGWNFICSIGISIIVFSFVRETRRASEKN